MKFRLMFATVLTAFALNLSLVPSARPAETKSSTLAVHDTWRKLWEDHIGWTRNVIIGVLDSLAGTSAYEARLLENYEDMEDALSPYFGDDAEELGDLIQDHLLIAVEILTAAKAGDEAAKADAIARWYENAHEIAVFMAEINPKYWPLSEGDPMWKEHLDATLAEAVTHLTGDFGGEVAAYDQVHDMALEMADFFSNGLIGAFPNQFTGRH